MRVLQISSARTFGGGERHFVDLCRGLQERGVEIFVAIRPTAEWRDRLDFIPAQNFHSSSIRNSFGMFNAKRVAGFLDENEIDIIHAHVGRDYLAASLAGRLSRKTAFVLTRHVMFPMRPFHKIALNNLRAAIAVSPGVVDRLKDIFPADKIRLIVNGLNIETANGVADLKREFREFHSLPADALVVGTLGELTEAKGQMDLVLAANEVAKEVPNVYFVVAGVDNTIEKKFRRELRRLVGVFGLDDRFLWLDWLEDTAPFFAGIDLFVSPSHSESFGLAILEAMARGIAVVATETDGARLLIGPVSELVPIERPVELAAAITGTLKDSRRRSEAGAILQAAALKDYSLDKMVASTAELYKELVPGGSAR